MPGFDSRAEYENWKEKMIEQLRGDAELKDSWVCPKCLTSHPGSRLRCNCGFLAEQSLYRYFRAGMTSSELYRTIRHKFHEGSHEVAVFLSSYLIKRFPEAEEAMYLREYREYHPGNVGQKCPSEALSARGQRTTERPPLKAGQNRRLLAVGSLFFLSLILAAVFLVRFAVFLPVQRDHAEKKLAKSTNEGTHAGGIEGKIITEMELQGVRTPRSKSGFEKGVEIAGEFLTNKPSVIREKCYQAMRETQTGDEEYQRGCLEGYASTGLLSTSQESQAQSAPPVKNN